jgi:hypothetical protein
MFLFVLGHLSASMLGRRPGVIMATLGNAVAARRRHVRHKDWYSRGVTTLVK